MSTFKIILINNSHNPPTPTLQAIIIEGYGLCEECLSSNSGMFSEGYKIFKNQ